MEKAIKKILRLGVKVKKEAQAAGRSGLFGDKRCAEVVRGSLNGEDGGGLEVEAAKDENNHRYAKYYGTSYLKAGFELIVSVESPSSYPPVGYVPQLGDVMVMDTYPNASSPAGHTAMFIGRYADGSPIWYSDWPQRRFWANSGYEAYGASYKIYRYPIQ